MNAPLRTSGRAHVRLCSLTLGVIASLLTACQHAAPEQAAPSPAPQPARAAAPAPTSAPLHLVLQQFNGCSILGNGAPVAKGSAAIPYPDRCVTTAMKEVTPTDAMPVSTDAPYVLNQLTLMDTVIDRHTNFADYSDAMAWMAHGSRFQALDWSGLKATLDEWRPYGDPTLANWTREVFFGGASWMQHRDDTFRVDVLDGKGQVRQTVVYRHADFFDQSPTAFHTRISWRVNSLAPPEKPGDHTLHPAPYGDPPNFHTAVRIDLATNTAQDKVLRFAGLKGDGALRVTWSLMPGQPFYFPVRFVQPADLPRTCFGPDDAPQPCHPGIEPQITLSPPKSGGVYQPGETIQFYFDLYDGQGTRLYPMGRWPTYDQFFSGKSNGIRYWNKGHVDNLEEGNAMTAFKVLGPLSELTPVANTSRSPPYVQFPAQALGEASEGEVAYARAAEGGEIGLLQVPWSNRVPLTLPKDARPGTYVALLKAHRQDLGERVARTAAVMFQVGTANKTPYPGRTGNCESCHVGPTALSRIEHGQAASQAESCKGCHANITVDWGRDVHRIHAQSPRYTAAKNDCSVCHTSRQDVTTASLEMCESCHPNAHGDTYFRQRFTFAAFESCGQTCHDSAHVQGHVLPKQ